MTGRGADGLEHRGLSAAEADARLAEFGPNALPAARPVRWWTRVLGQLRSSIIYILLFATERIVTFPDR